MSTLNATEVLQSLFVKHDGNWQNIYNDIQNKASIEPVWIDEAKKEPGMIITLVDSEYPGSLKNTLRPPLALATRGNLSVLDAEKKITVIGFGDKASLSEYNRRKTVAAIKLLCSAYPDLVVMAKLDHGVGELAIETALSCGHPVAAFSEVGLGHHPLEASVLASQRGLLISTKPSKVSAPVNDEDCERTLAGVSGAVLVTAGSVKDASSTTLIAFALSCGKDIYAIPDGFMAPDSLSNSLLREGATFYDAPEDMNWGVKTQTEEEKED